MMNTETAAMFVQLLGYVISGVVALFVATKQHNKTTALIEYRLQKLEESVNKHNDLVTRVAALEAKVELIK